MKKVAIISLLMIIIMTVFSLTNKVQAVENSLLSNEVEGKLIEIKKDETPVEETTTFSFTDAYGVTAYILNIIRIYSIPFCFLGIAIGAIHQYVIGIRKLDTLEKGMGLIVTFITVLVICQVLPLAFAVFVKFGRG